MSLKESNMICNDIKKALLSDPGFNDESGHVDSCAICQSYRAEVDVFNDKLAVAMDLRVPELTVPELPDIDTAGVVSLASRRAVSKPVWYAAAATVLLAVVVGVQVTNLRLPGESLADQVLAHVDHEPLALLSGATPVNDEHLHDVVPSSIGTMNHDTGLITYAETCPINGHDVPHLVLQGERGPITILLMPDEKISESKVLSGDGVRGYLLQNGSGSIAIIGDRDEELDRVKENVMNSVAWDTST